MIPLSSSYSSIAPNYLEHRSGRIFELKNFESDLISASILELFSNLDSTNKRDWMISRQIFK